MIDQRVEYLRGVLGALIESLEATMLLAGGADEEETRKSAALLLSRLAVANRSAAGKYSGSPRLLAATDSLSAAIVKLDDAFIAYRKALVGHGNDRNAVIAELGAHVAKARAEDQRWA